MAPKRNNSPKAPKALGKDAVTNPAPVSRQGEQWSGEEDARLESFRQPTEGNPQWQYDAIGLMLGRTPLSCRLHWHHNVEEKRREALGLPPLKGKGKGKGKGKAPAKPDEAAVVATSSSSTSRRQSASSSPSPCLKGKPSKVTKSTPTKRATPQRRRRSHKSKQRATSDDPSPSPEWIAAAPEPIIAAPAAAPTAAATLPAVARTTQCQPRHIPAWAIVVPTPYAQVESAVRSTLAGTTRASAIRVDSAVTSVVARATPPPDALRRNLCWGMPRQ